MSLSGTSLQGGGSTSFVQGAAASGSKVQKTNSNTLTVQPTTLTSGSQGSAGAGINQGGVGTSPQLGASTTANVSGTPNVALAPDPAAAAAAAKAAQDAARAGQLRANITDLINNVKTLLSSRYGEIDAAAGEQAAKLDSRFAKEAGDITDQAGQQSDLASASAASAGSYDSSYRARNQDQITQGAQSQIGDLGTELSDNKAAIGSSALKQKAGIDAQKGGYDVVASHLAEETNPDNLVSLRNQIDSQLATIKSGNADNSTGAQARSALETIAPSSARVQQLQTTLAKIVGGGADAGQKAAVAQALVVNSGVDPADQQKLLQAFQSDLSTAAPAQPAQPVQQ